MGDQQCVQAIDFCFFSVNDCCLLPTRSFSGVCQFLVILSTVMIALRHAFIILILNTSHLVSTTGNSELMDAPVRLAATEHAQAMLDMPEESTFDNV